MIVIEYSMQGIFNEKIQGTLFDENVCLFVWFDSLRPINNLSVI